MRAASLIAILAVLSVLSQAQPSGAGSAGVQAKSDSKTKPGGTPSEAGAPKAVKSFDLAAMDPSANPCTNFYQYACGNWVKNNPIPPDQARWGRFGELAERNSWVLKQILEKDAAANPQRSAVEQQVGDFYATCMDESAANAKGAAPLKPWLEQIAAIQSKDQLSEWLIKMQREGTATAFFTLDPDQDFKDATQVIAEFDQGGLGLPDRDYYLKDDARSVKNREDYIVFVTRIFTLIGDTPEQAATEAGQVMSLETALAKMSMDLVARREPANVYHKMTVAELQKLAPNFDWNRYLVGMGVGASGGINVAVPDFFKGFSDLVASTPLDQIKNYLRFHMARRSANFLSQDFVNASFEFYGKALSGQKEIRPRWKRCVGNTDRLLGEALGQEYVRRTFGTEGKERTLKLVGALERALDQDIKDLPWMTPETKAQAKIKLEAIANKIGYPDKWRDYSHVNIVRGELLNDVMQAATFEKNRQLSKIGKPVDKLEWGMTPPTVNAYYDPQLNNINFPAGILQPPFYDNQVDDAVNYGGIGVVIGHELTHGFDDQGRQFDAQGNLRDWWTPADSKAFDERADCIVKEYGSFVASEDVKLNGKLTLGENTADNGGLRIAYMALMDTLAREPAQKNRKTDGYTPEQRFFIGFGQVWCENSTPQAARQQALTDPHSLGKYRVNGTVQNDPDFGKAFGCKAGDAMMPVTSCRVW